MTDRPLSFMEHLNELRRRLVFSAVALTVATIVAFFFYSDILELLSRPYREATGLDLAVFQPTEAFTLALRISLFAGVVIASPFLIYQLWAFISPALTQQEKKYVIPSSAALGILFMAGVVGGFFALPLTLDVLLGFGQDLLQPTIGAEYYLRFAMRFLLAFGIALEFPVFLFAGAAIGFLTSDQLKSWRRYAVAIILVGAALLTPGGDPVTLLLLATPMYVLYEVTILAIKLILKK